MTAAASTDADLLTIDQLADRSGISVRTIRFYAGKGLLPPPQLRGRLGLYGQDHLARLDLISELTGLGFTLAAIEGFLEKLPDEIGAEDLVLQRALLVPWVPERLEEIDAEELNRRAGRTLREDEVDALEALGVLERHPNGTILLHGAAGLATALESLAIDLPPDLLRRSHALIAKHTAALAEDLMQLFQDEVLQPYRDRGRPAAERARLRELYTRLKPITIRGVMTAFGRAVNRAIRERHSQGS
ncbi:MerR family transcriptional regulator [Pseudonocardia acaciae]|uniref:MerR family transcriptional regulator n=1 Tax=Pseudonocardia acaciae TaxID=551276 RepID=UPI00048E77C3|nr:MerR family transcriptional regulator [Pseudonocardia acaciae]